MPKVTIKELQKQLEAARLNGQSYYVRNQQVERELKDAKEKIEELIRDKRWIQQLCQQQSSAIASYMGSR